MNLLAMRATFRAMSPENGGDSGAAAVADEPKDGFDALAETSGNFFDEPDIALALEDPDAKAEPVEGAAAVDEANAVLPDEIEVDGAPVPLADLLEGYKANAANTELIEHGKVYQGTIEAFNSGPEGARAVVEAMIEATRKTYGEEAVAGLAVPDALPDGFKEEDLTDNERALFNQNRALERRLEDQQKSFQQVLDELQPVVSERRMQQAGDAYAATVNVQFPTANVDAKTIVAMMKETGLDDPVKAYKLSTYDTAAESARVAKAEETKPTNTMPRQGSAAKTFDPSDKSLTADRMVELMKQGFRPISG